MFHLSDHLSEERPRILLAEQAEGLREDIRTALVADGFDVVDCSNAVDLLCHLRSYLVDGETPDEFAAIISNACLPGVISSYLVLCCLHRRPRCPPILLLTRADYDAAMRWPGNMEASMVIATPFDMDELLDVVWRVVKMEPRDTPPSMLPLQP